MFNNALELQITQGSDMENIVPSISWQSTLEAVMGDLLAIFSLLFLCFLSNQAVAVSVVAPPVHCYGRYHVVCIQAPCDPGFNPSGTSCTPSSNTMIASRNTGKPLTCGGTNPCNVGTGNKFQPEPNYVGIGYYPIRLYLTYNSGGSLPAAVKISTWGSQWRGTYNRSIVYTSNTSLKTASLIREDGTTQYFSQSIGTGTPPLTTTTWTSDADVVGILIETGVDTSGNPTGWTYANENDEVERYDALGKLITLTNRAGLVQTLSYSDGTAVAPNGGVVLDATGTATTATLPAGKLIRVSDIAGHPLNFGYDTTGRVVKMTDPAGGTYLYTYSGPLLTDNLTTVTYPDGKIRTYLYGETANVSATPAAGISYTHALTGILDENGTRYASWTYDANGLATSSEHGAFGSGIDHVGLAYTAPDANGNSSTVVTDPRGNVRTYTFSTLLGVVKNTGITGQPCNGCSAAFTYDANGNVASRTDFKGNKTCYAYDLARNLETVRLEGVASGTACPTNLATYVPSTVAGSVERKTSTQWHSTYRLATLVAEPLHTIGYNYDAQGNLLTRTVQPTADVTGGAGLTAAAAGTPRTTTYTYNPVGQVLTVDGPRTDVADVASYTYNPADAACGGNSATGCRGQLASVTNALNQTTTLGNYDANGHPGTLTDPNGLVTTLSYDPRSRLISRTTGSETTGYSYDGVGQIKTVTAASGAIYSYTYDPAHRLTDIADNLGNHIHYTLDVMGNRTKEETFDNTGTLVQTHSRTFDALNRLYQDIGAINQTTTYTYDANGNLTSITDPLNRQTLNTYDALNRLSQNTDASNGQTRYGYNGLDQLTQVIDPKNLTTQYSRDGLNNLNQQTSPDTGITGYSYDAAGNVLTRTDAKGQIATYTYDALNRVTSISYTGAPAQNISYTYDQGTNGLGHLTQITDLTGTTNYSYDVPGRLIGETKLTHGITYTSGYGYDTQGRLSSMTYPSGRIVNYTFDNLGRIKQITSTFNAATTTLASNIVYEPFGGVHSFNFGDGTTAPIQTYTRQRSMLEAVSLLTARKIDALRVTHERCEQEIREQEFAKLASEAQLTALRSQVNPHFLFNALTTIGYLIQTAPDKAFETLMRLTQLLRRVLKSTDEFCTLGEEINLIENYLDIERMRFEERLQVEIDVPQPLRKQRIPSLILQPLIENSIKHAISENKRGGKVTIIAAVEHTVHGENLLLQVFDTGAGDKARDFTSSNGIGLENIRERLASYYGKKASFEIKTDLNRGTTAEVRFPLETVGTQSV